MSVISRGRSWALTMAIITIAIVTVTSQAARESQAQQRSAVLPSGWSHHEVRGFVQTVGVACGQKVAFVRGSGGRVLRWDGASLTMLPRLTEPSFGSELWTSPSGDLYMLASNKVAHWNGRTWSMHELPPGPGELSGIWGRDDDQIFLVGRGRVVYRNKGPFASYDAGTWRDMSAIWGQGAADLWIGGQGGTILHHDGRSWTRMKTGSTAWIKGIWGSSATDLWAWSQGWSREKGRYHEVLYWDGQRWSNRAEGLPGPVSSIGGASPGDIYAVGRFGLARRTATSWSVELTPEMFGQGFHQMVGVCATDRHIIVGDMRGGALIRPRLTAYPTPHQS